MMKDADSLHNPFLKEELGVHCIDMATRIEEQVVLNEDGSYSIFINSRLNWERQMLAYQHAIAHIMNDDFEKADSDEIEKAM